MNAVPPLGALQALPGADRTHGPGDLGLVMGGGGARAAYQVGFLRCVARRFPELRIPYITGVSAGAINAALLAGHHGTFLQAVQELTQLWSKLAVGDVFRVDGAALAKSLMGWARQLVAGGIRGAPPRVRGLVDTDPLRRYLEEVLHAVDGELTGITYNLEHQRLRAVALSTSSYSTGQSVTWIQGQPDVQGWERPQRRARLTTLTVNHVMASAALPLFFPAIQLEDGWYGDGGIRLTAPLGPALHLGARRILAISTRYERTAEEAADPVIPGYPPPAQVMGVLMNSIFLDLLDADAIRLELLNRLVEQLPEDQREGIEPVNLLVLRPSRDLGKLANDFEPQLPRGFRYLTRALGTRETRSPDFLSLVLFQPDYLEALMDIGERDAQQRADEIAAFLHDTP
jgi:NTE family protein